LTADRLERFPLVVAGAGLAGLSAAHHARRRALVFDRAAVPGGTARSWTVGGFTFDFTGHLLHLHRPAMARWVKSLLAGNWVERRRSAWIHSHGVLTPYPFQANLHGLPAKVVRECVAGVRRARARYGDRPLEGLVHPSFDVWCRRLFGDGITRHFMRPYNEKLWTVPATDMTPDWCGAFVPVPSLAEVESGARRAHRKSFGYNTRFLYPRRGGIQVLAEAIARNLDDLRLGVSLESVDWRRRRVRLSTGETVAYGRLISTLPLPELLRRLDPFPTVLREPLRRLRWTTVTCINIGVARPQISRASWIYYPEKKYPFYRVGFPMNFTPHVVPRGGSSMYVEVSHRPGAEPRSPAAKTALVRRVRRGLEAAGVLRPTDRLPVVEVATLPYAYVIYDAHRAAATRVIFDWLEHRAAAESIGRYGGWKYSFMEEALWDGRAAALRADRALRS
jgi:protoporphyrinogen oxidase